MTSDSPLPALTGVRICILARKRLRYHTRVVRQAAALSGAGAHVVVFSMQNPLPELMRLAARVRWVEVDIVPWPVPLLQRMRAWAGRMLRPPAGDTTRATNLMKRTAASGAGTQAGGIHRPAAPGAVLGRLVPFYNILLTWRFARRALRELRSECFDFCQAHDSFALPAAHALAGAGGARLLYDAVEAPDERSGSAHFRAPAWLRAVENRRDTALIRGATGLFSVGPSLARWTAERYGVPLPTVVRNCALHVPGPAASTLKADLGIGDQELLGIMVGLIYPGQGPDQMLQALRRADKKMHVAAIGPVADFRYLHDLARDIHACGLADRFHLLAPRPQHEIIPYAAGADFGMVLVQPDRLNRRLALPNKLFEYVMAGLPVLAGDIPDVREIVSGYGIGEICTQTDPDDIVRACAALSAPGRLAALKVRVAAAAKELCWERECEQFLGAYRTLCPRLKPD